MTRKSIILCVLGLVAFANNSIAQLPDPIRNYPLDNMSGKETVNRRDGAVHGTVENYPDRFGDARGAMLFTDGAYISTPNFFESSMYQNGFTISFWTYIDENISKITGVKPWTDADPVYQAFYARENDQTLLGLYRKHDRVVIDRYTIDGFARNKNWGIWLWDPINFTNRTGWYHITLSYHKNQMTTYMLFPDGKIEYSLHYLGLQSLSTATEWGIGNNRGKSLKIIDDLKVFNMPLDKEQVRTLYGQDAPPSGMYNISIAANASSYIHVKNNVPTDSAPIELQNFAPEYTAQYRWVFEPVSGQDDVYTIRMAYYNMYLHLANHSAATSSKVELYYYDSQFASAYQWRVTPAGDGYFYIQSNIDRRMHLHPQNHSYAPGANLEVLSYVSSQAPVYKWRLNLIKTQYELKQNDFKSGVSYEVISNNNTTLGLLPRTPFTTASTVLLSDRAPYTSLQTFYSFKKDMDDSYQIINLSFPNKLIHPENRTTTDGTKMELNDLNSRYLPSYRWIVERASQYGRKFEIKPAINQTVSVYAGPDTKAANSTLRKVNEGNLDAHLWQLYDSGQQPNANKQIYDLAPGIYKISTLVDGNRSLAPQSYSWLESAGTVIKTFEQGRFTSFYWVVDYERDNNNKPVRDGSYTIQLLGTDALYLHPSNHSVSSSSRIETLKLNRNYINTFKWYIRPTRDGDGAFYIQSAADQSLFMHLENNTGIQDNKVELYTKFDGTPLNTYKWKFEKVTIDAPIATGTYLMKITEPYDPELQEDVYMHVENRTTTEGSRLEVLTYAASFRDWFLWDITKNPDGTYSIKRHANMQYAHTKAHKSASNTGLEVLQYNATYAPYYKWVIVPGFALNSYRFQLFADPTQYMHTVGDKSRPSTLMDIAPINVYIQSFEWSLIPQ